MCRDIHTQTVDTQSPILIPTRFHVTVTRYNIKRTITREKPFFLLIFWRWAQNCSPSGSSFCNILCTRFRCTCISCCILNFWFVLYSHIIVPCYSQEFYLVHSSIQVYTSVFFLDCPKVHFQDFQKTLLFRYFLQILKFGPENFRQVVIKISDKNLRSSWGSDIPLELILYPCFWKSCWALFTQFYGFILFLNSWIFEIQFEEHLRIKYSFGILGLSWKNL